MFKLYSLTFNVPISVQPFSKILNFVNDYDKVRHVIKMARNKKTHTHTHKLVKKVKAREGESRNSFKLKTVGNYVRQ